MRKYILYLLAILLAACSKSVPYSDETIKNDLRVPAYPLLMLHPHLRLWSTTDQLTEKNMIFTNGKNLPFVGFLRVDGTMYRFMGRRELPMQAIATMAYDYESWEGKYTSLRPDEGWEQPDFNDQYWQVNEGAFGTRDRRETRTQWLSTEALIAAHCENKKGSALIDFGLFAEEPGILVEGIAPVSNEKEWIGKYTTEQPEEGWEMAAFNDSAWAQGSAAFGTEGGPSVGTPWNTNRLWIRREVSFDPSLVKNRQLFVRYSYNDGMQLLINGKELVRTGTKARNDVKVQIPDSILETMKDGKALFAARCVNWGGTSFADFGLYGELKEAGQKSVDVQATQTHYIFDCGDVELKLTFTAPYLLDDLELLSRPVNYISYQAKALDGKEHDVAIYFEMDPHKAFRAGQSTEMYEKDGWVMMKTGRENQKLWVDKLKDAPAWGYFYLGAKENVTCAQGDAAEMRAHFMKEGDLKEMRRSNEKRYAAIAQKLEMNSEFPQHLIAAFDGLYTMAYFGEDLRPYWNKDGDKTIEGLYEDAEKVYKETMARCYAFDRQLMENACRVGGKEYAELCASAYRQAVSSFQMSKNSSDELLYFTTLVGSLDIYYAASPLFLCYNPNLLKAMLNPFFYYSESGKWNKPFPAHDLGGYPFVNGQAKGGDLPVEHAGNMLIMVAAMAKAEKDASYAKAHWETLSKWAGYLMENGVDTDKQIDTDSFAGRYSHNANLSAKGILGIASYALLAKMLGKQEDAEKYLAAAKRMAEEWEKQASDGDHYRLAFDQPDSWGQKYNLIWDKLLDLHVFPDRVVELETAFYRTKLNTYGCPLHSKTDYAKADWTVWTAALQNDRLMFREFLLPLYNYMNENKWRVPMADTYNVVNQKTRVTSWGRPVTGAYFIKLLE